MIELTKKECISYLQQLIKMLTDQLGEDTKLIIKHPVKNVCLLATTKESLDQLESFVRLLSSVNVSNAKKHKFYLDPISKSIHKAHKAPEAIMDKIEEEMQDYFPEEVPVVDIKQELNSYIG